MSGLYGPTPEMVAMLPDFAFPSAATVLVRSIVKSPSGQATETWVASGNPALVDIPARIAPLILVRPQSGEVTGVVTSSGKAEFMCSLKGYYPQITVLSRIEVDGDEYEVKGEEPDPNKVYTRLRLELRG